MTYRGEAEQRVGVGVGVAADLHQITTQWRKTVREKKIRMKRRKDRWRGKLPYRHADNKSVVFLLLAYSARRVEGKDG